MTVEPGSERLPASWSFSPLNFAISVGGRQRIQPTMTVAGRLVTAGQSTQNVGNVAFATSGSAATSHGRL